MTAVQWFKQSKINIYNNKRKHWYHFKQDKNKAESRWNKLSQIWVI